MAWVVVLEVATMWHESMQIRPVKIGRTECEEDQSSCPKLLDHVHEF